ncbi:methyltransferase domain-containing protein [Bombardia bombarda]|uniref:Protein-lysine N-methyltransferase EFM4 n=1 Tax=Bombardia bombarda TaxID=252184 RepID=A0AA39WTI9_9PEZI|nr:methyltransferase domain-containing protein [Bombardia bombarda]
MADTTAEKPAHLEPSQLGTKQYWDALYTNELTNHAANPADEGTVWFDDSDAEAKMVSFLDELEEEGQHEHGGLLSLDRATAAVLDLGCGNGSMLFALRDDGWQGRLLGVDYSEKSVALARRVAEARRRGGARIAGEDIEFRVWDVLGGSIDDVLASQPKTETEATQPHTQTTDTNTARPDAGWDLVLDKGTFDAISLSDERDAHGRRICEGYGARVLQLLRPGGVFLVTSCNWTEAELKGWFEADKEKGVNGNSSTSGMVLRQIGRVAYPSFSFGGVKGQTISTLCFVKEVTA